MASFWLKKAGSAISYPWGRRHPCRHWRFVHVGRDAGAPKECPAAFCNNQTRPGKPNRRSKKRKGNSKTGCAEMPLLWPNVFSQQNYNGMSTPQFRDAAHSRRRFVRTFALGSVTTVTGIPWVGTLLVSLLGENRAEAATSDQMNLQLTDFPVLQYDYGSVRVSVNPISGSSPNGNFYPIIVSRAPGNIFYAVTSNCPHRNCVTAAYDGNSISCPCHGSEFDLDGALMKGPATTNLARYAISYDGSNTLRVTVPGLGYSITNYSLVSGTIPRVRLDFPTFNQAQYQVRFRATATDPWVTVPFATTSTGAATNTVLTGSGSAKTVYVDRTSAAGFYTIVILISEV
jgi:Rieske Fe-S protein